MIGMLVHVNGTPIEMINVQNIESLDNDPYDGKHLYDVQACGKHFQITHVRKDGWEKLFIKILKRLQTSKVIDVTED